MMKLLSSPLCVRKVQRCPTYLISLPFHLVCELKPLQPKYHLLAQCYKTFLRRYLLKSQSVWFRAKIYYSSLIFGTGRESVRVEYHVRQTHCRKKSLEARRFCINFDFTKCVQSKVVDCICPLKRINQIHFLPNFSNQLCQPGVLSIRILLFGQMELDLPTPVSQPPSEECGRKGAHDPKTMFASIPKICLQVYQKYVCKY